MNVSNLGATLHYCYQHDNDKNHNAILAHTSKTERLTKEVKSIGQNFIAKKTKKKRFTLCYLYEKNLLK